MRLFSPRAFISHFNLWALAADAELNGWELTMTTFRVRNAALGGVLALIASSGAIAQTSTNCMAMGAGMVHCDSMDMSYDSGATNRANAEAGAKLGLAIRGMRERSLRAKIGKMVAGGDCQGAYSYALTKGRMDLAGEVRSICR